MPTYSTQTHSLTLENNQTLKVLSGTTPVHSQSLNGTGAQVEVSTDGQSFSVDSVSTSPGPNSITVRPALGATADIKLENAGTGKETVIVGDISIGANNPTFQQRCICHLGATSIIKITQSNPLTMEITSTGSLS